MLRLHPPLHTIQIHTHTHLDIVALWRSTGGEAGGDASPQDHFPWHITVWCGWPQLPCSSLHRLVLASSSCCCTLLWTPPICKCQPSREGGMAGRGLLFMWCYVMREESMEKFVTTVVWKGTGHENEIMIIPIKTILQTVSSKCNFSSLLSLWGFAGISQQGVVCSEASVQQVWRGTERFNITL